jgi:hypothetical protein
MKDEITKLVKSVTKQWTKQRKSEERNSRARYRRDYIYSDRINFTEIANRILPGAYKKASGEGRYTVSQRQMYYASREEFQRITGREITSQYFTATILRRYLNQNAVDWKITADPRGTLSIPNTEKDTRIPCGTIAIDEYLESIDGDVQTSLGDLVLDERWPFLAPAHRYQAVLYIEKEGFEPVLKEAQIAEKFDLAILSCKGQSVAAARKFVDHVCAVNGGIPLFTVHDFDEAGFQIAHCLTNESLAAAEQDRVAYHFKNKIQVVDFGLRLDDIKRYNLQSEKFKPRKLYLENATREEVAFLRSGRRVELNAFTAPEFVEWLEAKLRDHLPSRLVPKESIVHDAYRRAIGVAFVNSRLRELIQQGRDLAKTADIDDEILDRLSDLVKSENLQWDLALYEIAKDAID